MPNIRKFTTDDEIRDWCGYHPPKTDAVKEGHEFIRASYMALSISMNALLPEGPDKTVALRALRRAMMDANACLAVAGVTFDEQQTQ